MIKITKHPFERRSYLLSGDDTISTCTDWTDLNSWLNINAPGWVISSNILTLPKDLPAAETYFILRFNT